jgi:hypothetical protein
MLLKYKNYSSSQLATFFYDDWVLRLAVWTSRGILDFSDY